MPTTFTRIHGNRFHLSCSWFFPVLVNKNCSVDLYANAHDLAHMSREGYEMIS